MRHSRLDFELVRRFAVETGRALRSAQWHRQKNSREWREFMAQAVPPTAIVTDRQDAATRFTSAPEEMLEAALETWRDIADILRHARQTRDPNLAAFLKAEGEAQKRYREAKRLRDQELVSKGLLVPAKEFSDLKRSVLMPLRSVILNMPREAGPRANPFDHAYAVEALDEWVRDRFTPQLEAAISRVGHYAAAPDVEGAPAVVPDSEGVQGGVPAVAEGEGLSPV